MKREKYLDTNNPDEKIDVILKNVDSITNRKALIFGDFQSPALLVVDVQRFFTSPDGAAFLPAAPAIIKNINLLIERFRSIGRPVIFTKHVNTPENAGMMSKWWNSILTADNIDSEFDSRIDVLNDRVIEKTRFDAFFNTNLEEILANLGVDSLVICGVIGHLCVETTVRSAFVRGFRTIVPADAICDYNQYAHESVLVSLAHGFAHIERTIDVIKAVGSEQKD